MQDTSEQISAGTKLVFSRCDICEREYGEEEMKLKNAMGEYSEDLEGTSPYFSYVSYVAKALRYCLHISHDKPAFEGEYLI